MRTSLHETPKSGERGFFRIQSRVTVIQATSEWLSAHGFVALGSAEGTISFVLFTAACMSMTGSRLPRVWAYSQAIATDSAVTCKRYTGNDWPAVSAPEMKNRGRCQ